MRTLPLVSQRVVLTFAFTQNSNSTDESCAPRAWRPLHFMFIAAKHKKILKFIRRMTKLVNDALYIHAHRANTLPVRQWICQSVDFFSFFFLFHRCCCDTENVSTECGIGGSGNCCGACAKMTSFWFENARSKFCFYVLKWRQLPNIERQLANENHIVSTK